MHLKFSRFTAVSTLSHMNRPALGHAVKAAACFMFLLSMANLSCAQDNFEEDFEDLDKPWKEVALQLPPAPLAENLMPFYVSATATQTFSIDAKSLTLGTDGVIRYILVASSGSGAKNISYEGIRCSSFEKKLYAFGHPDGSWSRSRSDKWEPIRSNAANRQHAALAQDYFCQGLTVAGKAEQMVTRIRGKRSLLQ